jgi:hypothetical protein
MRHCLSPIFVAAENHVSQLAYWLSAASIIAGAFGSAAGVVFPSIFRGPAVMAGSARGTDIVILLVAIPILAVSLTLSRRGSGKAQIAWLGALSYILYNSVVFAFGVPFNVLFLVYVATLSLSFWSVIALLPGLDAKELAPHFTWGRWTRVVAVYLFVAAAFFFVQWLRDILPAVFQNTTPASYAGTGLLTNPFHVLDLGFSIPISVTSVIWMWKRRPWGMIASGALLVYFAIETTSISTDQLLGSLADPNSTVTSMAAVPIFAILTLVDLIFVAVFFHNFKE